MGVGLDVRLVHLLDDLDVASVAVESGAAQRVGADMVHQDDLLLTVWAARMAAHLRGYKVAGGGDAEIGGGHLEVLIRGRGLQEPGLRCLDGNILIQYDTGPGGVGVHCNF